MIVNGKTFDINGTCTYTDLVQLATGGSVPDGVLTVTYTHARSSPEEGHIYPGDAIDVDEKTIVNVSRTNNG